MRTFALAVVLVTVISFATGAQVRADMGVPGMQRTRPSHRVSTAEPFPNHVFIIFRPYTRDTKDEKSGREVKHDESEAEYVELAPNNPIFVPFDERATHSIRYVRLLIVPRAVAAPYQSALALAKAIEAHQVTNAIQYDFPTKESVPQWSDPNTTIDYRIQRVANGTELEVMRSPQTRFPCGVFCLFVCSSPVLVGLSLWLMRRRAVPKP